MFGMSAWWHSIFFRQWYCHLEGNSIVTYILEVPNYSHNVWSRPTRHTQLTSFSLPAVCIFWLVWAAALPMNWKGGKCDAWVCAGLTHPTPPYTSYTVLQIMNAKVWYTATSLVYLNCSILLHKETQSPLYNWSYLILILHAIILLESTLHKETQSPLYNWSYLILILHAIILLENTLHKETQSPLYNWSYLDQIVLQLGHTGHTGHAQVVVHYVNHIPII